MTFNERKEIDMNENYIVPSATMKELPKNYELNFSLPGVAKEEVELKVEGRALTVKTHAQYAAPEGFRQVLSEFERTNFAISVDLPELADSQGILASMENGKLTVTVPKRAETAAHRIEIK